MAEPKKPHKLLATVKAPLIFALILGLVAGIVTTVAASGGTGPQIQGHTAPREIRFDLGFIAFGIAFIAALVVLAMLSLTFKENPDHLSEGSGVSRRSEDRLKERKAQAKVAADAKVAREARGSAEPGAPGSDVPSSEAQGSDTQNAGQPADGSPENGNNSAG